MAAYQSSISGWADNKLTVLLLQLIKISTMENSKNNTDPKETGSDKTAEIQKQVQGSDADIDHNVGKINDIPDAGDDIKGSDADVDHGGESSI